MKRAMAMAMRVAGKEEAMMTAARGMATVTRLAGKQQQQEQWQW
jgi:hypothetical protein